MELRTLIGPHAGEILDFCPEAASAMLADGRAEMPSEGLHRPPMAGPEFFSGGEVSGASDILVGEVVSDCVVPRAVAETMMKISAASERKPASARRGGRAR